MNFNNFYEKGLDDFKLKKYEDAIINFNKAIKLQNDFFNSFRYRGESKSKIGKYKEAIKDLDKAINLEPNLSYLYFIRGRIKDSLFKYAEAIKDCNEAITLDPNNSLHWESRGYTNYQLKKYTEAIKDCNEAIKLKPDSFYAICLRGLVKEKLGNYEEGLKDFDKAIDLNPNPNNAFSFFHRGFARYKVKKYQDSIKDFDKAIDLDPDVSIYYENRGNANYFLEKYIYAIKDYDKAIDLNPSETNFYYLRGKAKKEIKEFDDALLDFQRCKDLDKNNLFIDQEIKEIIFYKENIKEIETKRFKRTSIINFPDVVFQRDNQNQNKLRLKTNIYNLKNYSNDTKYNKYYDVLNWHIKDFRDYIKLIDDLKRIPRISNLRTYDELIDLIEIIQKEEIDLFILKDSKNKESNNEVASFSKEYNFITINANYIYDIDRMCISLSHELIHYFHNNKPFNIEIEDSIIDHILYSKNYKNLTEESLQCELEASTFDYYPHFISKYYKKQNLLEEDFQVSQIRLQTIKWICKNRVLPLKYLLSSSVYKLDFSS